MNRLDPATATSPLGHPTRSEDCVGHPIEQQFRETTGSRFGLEHSQVRTPLALRHLLLLEGLALVVCLAVGDAVAALRLQNRLPRPDRSARVSLVALRRARLLRGIPGRRLDLGWVVGRLPPPTLRCFAWLMPTPQEAQK